MEIDSIICTDLTFVVVTQLPVQWIAWQDTVTGKAGRLDYWLHRAIQTRVLVSRDTRLRQMVTTTSRPVFCVISTALDTTRRSTSLQGRNQNRLSNASST